MRLRARRQASMLLAAAVAGCAPHRPAPTALSTAGAWRATLDLAGGPLRFAIVIDEHNGDVTGRLCNADQCDRLSSIERVGGAEDSLILGIADYNASIRARVVGDSLRGFYHNVGSRGPRTIPFHAARGRWPADVPPAALLGRWDAVFTTDGRSSPRVIELRRERDGLVGTVISNNGDYGTFWGRAAADSFRIGHFDGSFVYALTGRLDGDTLRGLFHAGLRTQTPFVAWRSTGRPHLTPPTQVTRADTSRPFRFAFPDVDGRLVTSEDARFRGKVLVVEVIGTWCPTCHDAAPAMRRLYERYHARGLEVVSLAYEVTGDTAQDAPLVRRFVAKFDLPWPVLLAGISDTRAAAETLPLLEGFTAFPTTIFVGRDGRIRRVHAGFYGPVLGEGHAALVREFEAEVERLLAEPGPR